MISKLGQPTYLRIVATTRCNLSCSYCHREGDDLNGGQLNSFYLKKCLKIAATKGIRKFKFLGGEPLLRKDLAEIIEYLRDNSSNSDISIITAGVVPIRLIDKVFAKAIK